MKRTLAYVECVKNVDGKETRERMEEYIEKTCTEKSERGKGEIIQNGK